MFTSRAEYRLALREDNARDRLYPHACRLGLIGEADFSQFAELDEATKRQIKSLGKIRIKVAELNGLSPRVRKNDSMSLAELVRQPDIELHELMPILLARSVVASESAEVTVRAAIQIRYQGYIDKQTREIERFKRQENDRIEDDFDYSQIRGLKIEAREKLSRYRPVSIGQASRLEGVTPSDLAVVSVYLRRHKGKT